MCLFETVIRNGLFAAHNSFRMIFLVVHAPRTLMSSMFLPHKALQSKCIPSSYRPLKKRFHQIYFAVNSYDLCTLISPWKYNNSSCLARIFLGIILPPLFQWTGFWKAEQVFVFKNSILVLRHNLCLFFGHNALIHALLMASGSFLTPLKECFLPPHPFI